MSLGAERVRISFNPGGDDLVTKIKQHTADLINLCATIAPRDAADANSGETRRLVALAQTAYEEAAMWAVKAATTPK